MESYNCVEHIDRDTLKKIIKTFPEPITPDQQYTLSRLKRLDVNTRKTQGMNKVEFILKEKLSKTKGHGRLYAKNCKPTLQELPSNIRKALAHQRYSDIDMKNAHPSIMNQLFKQYEISCPLLDKYIDNRDEFLEQANKKVWTALLNNKKPDPTSELQIDYWNDIRVACDKLFSLEKYAIYKKLGEIKNPDNIEGWAVSALATDHERKCISSVIQSLQQQGFTTSTVIHDGCLVQALNVEDSVLRIAEKEIMLRTGLTIDLTVKPMNDFQLHVDYYNDPTAVEGDREQTDMDACTAFKTTMEENGHRFVSCAGELVWYNPDAGVWRSLSKVNPIRKYISTCESVSPIYQGSVRKQDMLFIMLISNSDEDDLFFVNAPKTTYRKLAFNNGVFNFETKTLDEFSPDYRFLFKIQWDWNESDVNLKLQKEIYDKIIHGTFGKERGEYYLKSVARSMAGEVYDKNFFAITGDGNSGKGVNCDLLEGAFGEFIGVFNSGNLTKKLGDDSEKMLGFLHKLKNKRIAYSNESSPDAVFDAQMIKMFASGGDTLKVRSLYKESVEFKLEALPFLFCNDFNNIKGACDATTNRIKIIESQYRYLNGDQYDKFKQNANVRIGDDSIKNVFVKREDVLKNFCYMVCQAYTQGQAPTPPSCVKMETNEWVGSDDMSSKIGELVNQQEGSDLQFSLIYSFLQKHGISGTKTKVGKKLNELGFEKIDKKDPTTKKTARYILNINLIKPTVAEEYGEL